MTISFYCILVASFMPILWVAFAKRYAGFKLKDNANPRVLLGNATGVAQRANWAQANAWEALTPFAAAVIVASIVGADQARLDIASVVFIIARLMHGIFYLTNQHKIRSIVWFVGIICVFYIYFLAAQV